MKIDVRDAVVKTASVEIKSLSLSGKQVTLAVFRQLLREPLLERDGELAGVPWGTVNYHPDRCRDDFEHIHVVWQKDNELRRSNVQKPSFGRWWTDTTDHLVQAAFCSNDHQILDWMDHTHGRGTVWFKLGGESAIHCTADEPQRPSGTSPLRGPQAGKVDLDHECEPENAFSAYLSMIEEEAREELRRRARISSHWQELNDLPQLFIAV